MASPFDAAWTLETEAAVNQMGEAITLGDVALTAVVSEVESSPTHQGPMVVNSGVLFQVFLTRLQVTECYPDDGAAERLKGKVVLRGTRRARVLRVIDLGGAGVQLDCGPVGDR
jgi:hypothetical protein